MLEMVFKVLSPSFSSLFSLYKRSLSLFINIFSFFSPSLSDCLIAILKKSRNSVYFIACVTLFLWVHDKVPAVCWRFQLTVKAREREKIGREKQGWKNIRKNEKEEREKEREEEESEFFSGFLTSVIRQRQKEGANKQTNEHIFDAIFHQASLSYSRMSRPIRVPTSWRPMAENT